MQHSFVATGARVHPFMTERAAPACLVSANEAGIDLLVSRNYGKAALAFHEALIRGSQIPIDSFKAVPTTLSTSKTYSDPIPSTNCPCEDVFILFDRALHITDTHDPLLTTAILTYNTGLAFHLQGIQRHCHDDLARALDYYTRAYLSLTTMTLYGHVSMHLVLLATVNNIGHVNACNRCYYETSVCCEELNLQLMRLISSPAASVDMMTNEEYRILFMNACLFQQSGFIASPAA